MANHRVRSRRPCAGRDLARPTPRCRKDYGGSPADRHWPGCSPKSAASQTGWTSRRSASPRSSAGPMPTGPATVPGPGRLRPNPGGAGETWGSVQHALREGGAACRGLIALTTANRAAPSAQCTQSWSADRETDPRLGRRPPCQNGAMAAGPYVGGRSGGAGRVVANCGRGPQGGPGRGRTGGSSLARLLNRGRNV